MNNKTDESRFKNWAAEVAVVLFMSLSLEILPDIFFENMGLAASLISVIKAPYFILSVIMTGAVYIVIRGFPGKALGRALAVILYLFFFIGNFVKLKYHDGVFKPMDIFQIQDFMEIVVLYVPMWALCSLIIALVAAVICIIVKKRKYIAEHRPNITLGIIGVITVLCLYTGLKSNLFRILGADMTDTSIDTKTCVGQMGIVPCSYISFGELTHIFPKPDSNYSKEYMEAVSKEFELCTQNKISDTKPNVILIMDESMFDITRLNDVSFSMDICENINKYKNACVISPRYGGGTGSVEFEGLTGMSNFFFPDNSAPYVTYWSKEKRIPGLAYEFSQNGYETTAVHPNSGKMYNRDKIYSYMGFDRFLNTDNTEFPPEERADDGYVKDTALADVIEKQLKSSDKPQFIFAVTIENHTLYNSKYDETEVKVSSDKLSKNQLHQLEQYSQGLLGADRLIQKMTELTDNTGRPTLLYIWGDHLPALSAFNTLGFIKDKHNKYSTPLIMYSNYKDMKPINECITPNQIAPQILRDAEVEHSSYFDYIYSLRSKYPIIHREFGTDRNDEIIKLYGEVQYDVLFGEQYLVK